MPELPEVETIVRQLKALGVEGRTILQTKVRWKPTIGSMSIQDFCQTLQNSQLSEVKRTGKWIHCLLSNGKHLFIHLRMSGSFSQSPGKHDRVVLKLSGGITLYYQDTRKFGRWYLVNHPNEVLSKLGPDALSKKFTSNYLNTLSQKSKRGIKALLLDQSCVAGLGNIYVDEALWESKIHPEQKSNTLQENEILRLYDSIRTVLEIGIRNQGTSLGLAKTNYKDVYGQAGKNTEKVKAYGRQGLPCLRCQTPLEKIKVAQRGTSYCPVCQKKHHVL